MKATLTLTLTLLLTTTLAVTAGCSFGNGQTCASQNECPNGEGCSADGLCVAMRNHKVLVPDQSDGTATNPGANFGQAGPGDFGGGGGATFPLPEDAVLSGSGGGNIGPINLAADTPAFVSAYEGGFWIYVGGVDANGDGAPRALAIISPASVGMAALLCTPGTYVADSSGIAGDLWAQACSINETDNNHYDEGVDSSVEVSPIDDDGFVPLTVHQTSGQTDFTATLALRATCG